MVIMEQMEAVVPFMFIHVVENLDLVQKMSSTSWKAVCSMATKE